MKYLSEDARREIKKFKEIRHFLTTTEMCVLEQFILAIKPAVIADKMFITISTLRKHLQHIKHKTGLHTTAKLIKYGKKWLNYSPHQA